MIIFKEKGLIYLWIWRLYGDLILLGLKIKRDIQTRDIIPTEFHPEIESNLGNVNVKDYLKFR